MKQLISLLVLVTVSFSSVGFAAKKPASIKPQKKTEKVVKSEKSKKNKWNKVCEALLDSSVKSTLKLEKSVQKKKKISKTEFEEKIQNELLVVQLNAWVCATSTQEQANVSAEELFLKDYSQRVQSKNL